MRLTRLAGAALATAMIGGGAHASPVDWEFSNVTLADGGEITGGFTFDLDTATYSNISIDRSDGSTQEAQSFSALSPAVASNSGFVIFVSDAADLTDTLFLQLIFDADLGEPGVFTSIFTGGSGTGRCAASDCSLVVATGASFVTGGGVAPVPLPAGGALLLAGLLGLGAVRRRKS